MASISDAVSVNATLSSTTVDTVTITQPWQNLLIQNRDGTNTLWYRLDGTVPVAEAEGAIPIMPNGHDRVEYPPSGIVKILGNGGNYSVIGTNDQDD